MHPLSYLEAQTDWICNTMWCFLSNWAPTSSLGNNDFLLFPCPLFALSCKWKQGKITDIGRVIGRVCKTELRSQSSTCKHRVTVETQLLKKKKCLRRHSRRQDPNQKGKGVCEKKKYMHENSKKLKMKQQTHAKQKLAINWTPCLGKKTRATTN